MTDPVGRPRISDPQQEPAPLTVCSICLSNYGPGKNHTCSKNSRRNNLEELIRSSSGRSRGKVLAGQLKEVFAEQGVTTKGGTVELETGTKPIKATLGVKQKPQPFFSTEAMNKLQAKLGVSDRKMLDAAHFLRVYCGRASVTDLKLQMNKRNHMLDQFFTSKMIPQTKYQNEVDEKGKKTRTVVSTTKPAVFTSDVQDLASKVMIERGLSPEQCCIQVGVDDGQNMVKVMMTIKPKDECQKEVKGVKSKYKEGYCPGDFKFSGVKKLIVLFVSPTCERHDNLTTILEELGLEAVDFAFSADLKMVLILCGKQAASSKHCCPFCSGSAPWTGKYQSLTIGSLWANYNKYVANGSKLKSAMKFGNVVNVPLLTGPNDRWILDIFNFPELHVLTGITGKIVKEFERKVFTCAEDGKNFMDRWMVQPSVNVSRTVYHGSASFKGNMAKKLLKLSNNLSKFVDHELDEETVAKATPFMSALFQFNLVVEACFGQDLDPCYPQLINDFMVTYRALGITIPLKVHLLESHLQEFLVRRGDVHGAGFWSEQAMEACHYDLQEEWEDVMVEETHPKYMDKLKGTVVRYNGKHI